MDTNEIWITFIIPPNEYSNYKEIELRAGILDDYTTEDVIQAFYDGTLLLKPNPDGYVLVKQNGQKFKDKSTFAEENVENEEIIKIIPASQIS